MTRIFILLLIILASCNEKKKKTELTKKEEPETVDSLDIKYEERYISDCIKLDSLLTEVMKYVERNKGEKYFQGQIDSPFSENRNVYVTFEYGNLFEKSRKHLFIRRYTQSGIPNELFTDIFLLERDRLVKLVTDTSSYGFYLDSMYDVNGDQYKDFIVHSYSGAGCCPRNDLYGYLYNPVDGRFDVVDMFNPEFDYTNKIVYEMSYGHPGDVQLEKYKWVGLEKKLIETISPTLKDKRMQSFAKPYTYTRVSYPSEKVTILNEMPKEYLKLKNFEYFISYQE